MSWQGWHTVDVGACGEHCRRVWLSLEAERKGGEVAISPLRISISAGFATCKPCETERADVGGSVASDSFGQDRKMEGGALQPTTRWSETK